MSSKKITDVIGRMVFDSRGYPTVEAEVQVNNNFYGSSISPSGTSKGKKEALEKHLNEVHRKHPGFTELIASNSRDKYGNTSYDLLLNLLENMDIDYPNTVVHDHGIWLPSNNTICSFARKKRLKSVSLIFLFAKSIISSVLEAKIVGMDISIERLVLLSREKPNIKPLVMVAPDLDVPGTKAKHCHKPIIMASLCVQDD